FQYFWYLFVFFSIYMASLVVPAIIFIVYMIFFFLPFFLKTSNFVSLFIEFKPLIAFLSMPLVIIGCYLVRLFLIALVTRGFWKLTERKSPTKEGIIPRNFPSRILNYYHIRSFLLKYPKNSFSKGIFPWVLPWFYNFVKSNQIGKGTTLEESAGGDKFLEIGQNFYMGVSSILSSHLVDGVFGNINYFKIKVGDDVTAAAKNLIGPGTEINNGSQLLPLASTGKHSVLRGKGYYFSEGAKPLRKIFKRKIKSHVRIDPKTLEPLSEDEQLSLSLEPKTESEEEKKDLSLNITTSSAISRVNIKFLAVYLPIFWLSGMLVGIMFYTFTHFVRQWAVMAFFLPLLIFLMWFVFIFSCFFFSKLFLILVNMIHKPKEGIFKAEIGDKDFEFWMLRTEITKIVFWLMRNWPLPWVDILAFKWFGIKMSVTSSLYDSWCDGEFIQFGRKNLVGQGANIMSSMVIGKYLVIKKVIFDDYVLIGAMTTVAPGTIVGKETLMGAISNTVYDQVLEPGWVYLGIPMTKYKPNKYAESRRDIISKKDVDDKKRFDIEHEANIEENNSK
ncbi:MAG: hypothetical protein ACW96S_06555, partial [Promethearchaeota archaeon]